MKNIFGVMALGGSLGLLGVSTSKAQDPDLVLNPDFEAVSARLDKGGTYFSYVDLSHLVEGIQSFAVDLQRELDPESPLKDISGKIAKTAAILGIDQLDDLRSSGAQRKDGLGQGKTYVKFEKLTGLFAQDAETRKPLRLAAYVPPTAGFVGVSRWNLKLIWDKGLEAAKVWTPEDNWKEFQAGLEKLKESEGVDLDKVIASIGREFGVALILDTADQKTVDTGSTKLKVPRPGFLFLLEVNDTGIFDSIVKAAKKESSDDKKIELTELGDWKVLKFIMPDAAKEWLSPAIAQRGKVLVFTVVEADLKAADKAEKEKKDFRTTADFQKFTKGLPTEYQGVSYISPEFTNAIRKAIDDALNASEVPADARKVGQQFVKNFGRFEGSAMIQIWDESGVQDISRSSSAASILSGSASATAAGSVAAAGVLGAIAVPNFIEAQVRAKVSKSKADMRSLATAIEAYYVDNNVYPPSTDNPKSVFGGIPDGAKHYSNIKVLNPKQAYPLTTPIGYVSSAYPDPFSTDNTPYAYASDKSGWILWTPGPDKTYNLDWRKYDPALSLKELDEALAPYTYDPTNGINSSGDIWRVRQ